MKKHRLVRKFLEAFAAVTFLSLLFWATFAGYAEIPNVHKSVQGFVSCASAETGWENFPIGHPICQEVLKGQYEIVWVAPGDRP